MQACVFNQRGNWLLLVYFM